MTMEPQNLLLAHAHEADGIVDDDAILLSIPRIVYIGSAPHGAFNHHCDCHVDDQVEISIATTTTTQPQQRAVLIWDQQNPNCQDAMTVASN